jgi:hypothetical protein
MWWGNNQELKGVGTRSWSFLREGLQAKYADYFNNVIGIPDFAIEIG